MAPARAGLQLLGRFEQCSALGVGPQRPKLVLKLLGIESLLTMTSKDRLDGGVTGIAEPRQADTTNSRFGVRCGFELGASS